MSPRTDLARQFEREVAGSAEGHRSNKSDNKVKRTVAGLYVKSYYRRYTTNGGVPHAATAQASDKLSPVKAESREP